MPRYFFNVKDGSTFLDKEGVSLSGIDEVRAQAVAASGEMLRDHTGSFWGGEEWRMWVTDEAGATVCGLRFAAE